MAQSQASQTHRDIRQVKQGYPHTLQLPDCVAEHSAACAF
ncbi:MAG: hypothetical protein PWP48_359 [Clostridiales bacterium]|nr:hypothetical protein [Clostridiales bacterium]MDK2991126.1 hypothetical protein [Clostridiales bacterium]